MRKQRLRKKHIPSFYFTKVLKRRSVIEELFTVPIILEMMKKVVVRQVALTNGI